MIKFCLLMFFSATLVGQSSWFNQNSSTGRDLSSVSFIDPNNGWIVGGVFAYSDSGIVLKTTNGGDNWIALPYSDPGHYLTNVQFTDLNTGYATGVDGNQNSIFLKTANGGINWQITFQDTLRFNSLCFVNSNTGWICGTKGFIARTTNAGVNWVIQQSTVSVLFPLNSISFFDVNTGCCVGDYGVLLWTSNGGANWVNSPANQSNYFKSVSFVNSSMCFTSGVLTTFSSVPSPTGRGIVFKTGNAGINWSNIYTYDPPHTFDVASFNSIQFVNSSTGWAGGTSGETEGSRSVMAKTTDGGVSWSEVNTNSVNDINKIYFVNSMTGWAVERYGIIIKTVTGGGPIGIHPVSSEIPSKFDLNQNYPNPFNPSTTINFDIPVVGNGRDRSAKLTIYDVIGREVATLINQQMQPGSYSVNWDASNYSSGIYFYKLESGEFIESKKMVLIK